MNLKDMVEIGQRHVSVGTRNPTHRLIILMLMHLTRQRNAAEPQLELYLSDLADNILAMQAKERGAQRGQPV